MKTNITAAMLARNALRNLFGLGLPFVVALIALPVLSSRLDHARFGVLGIVWVFFGLFAELGLGRATTKFAAAAFASGSADLVRIVRVGARAQLVAGVVLAVILAAIAAPLAGRIAGNAGIAAETTIVLFIVAAALPVIMVSAAYRGVLEAAHRFDLVNRVRIPLTTSTYLLPAFLAVAGLGLVAMTAALVVVRVAALASYYFMSAGLVGAHATIEQSAQRPHGMLRFGAWQTVSAVLAPVLVYLDRFLLGTIAGVAAVGLYTPAFEVSSRLLIIPASLVVALFPAFSAWSAEQADGRTARIAARAVLYVIAALIFPVLLLVTLGGDALRIWVPNLYTPETAVALAILAAGTLLNGAALIPATLLQGVGRPDIAAKLYVVELPCYVILMFALISRYGLVGAALAWSIRVSADALLLFIATHRLGALPWADLVRARAPQSTAGALLIATATGLLLHGLQDTLGRTIVIATALIVAVLFVWFYSLRADGRASIADALGVT